MCAFSSLLSHHRCPVERYIDLSRAPLIRSAFSLMEHAWPRGDWCCEISAVALHAVRFKGRRQLVSQQKPPAFRESSREVWHVAADSQALTRSSLSDIQQSFSRNILEVHIVRLEWSIFVCAGADPRRGDAEEPDPQGDYREQVCASALRLSLQEQGRAAPAGCRRAALLKPIFLHSIAIHHFMVTPVHACWRKVSTFVITPPHAC
jgi:hypothetical protein